MANFDKANEARVEKCLSRRYRGFDGKITTLGAIIAKYTITRKSEHTEEYATRKVHLCYAKLKNPKTTYVLWHIEPDGKELGTEVPKVVYDAWKIEPKPAPVPVVATHWEWEGAGRDFQGKTYFTAVGLDIDEVGLGYDNLQYVATMPEETASREVSYRLEVGK